MSINWPSTLRQAQEAVQNIFASCMQCAIGLYEEGDSAGQDRWLLPVEQFEPYCKKVQSLPGGERLCREDHIRRAKAVMASGVDSLTLCHAGVFNQALPIVAEGKVRAVLMYGQMWVEGDQRNAEARRRHEELIAHLATSEDDELELRVHYDEVKQLTKRELATLNRQLSLLQRLFYGMLNEELALGKYTEQVIHDLQIRLQPVLAHAENLYNDLHQSVAESQLDDDTLATANDLLQSALAMRALVSNLGDFMPAYQFRPGSLAALVEQASAMYRAEAERKEVRIWSWLQEPSIIQMSRTHMQHAIGNLLHNAIKYSFHGRYDLRRFIEIRGEVEGADYVLTFENYGVGILPEELERIFEPGYKGQLTRQEYRSGAGMGLAIVKEIIDKHRGAISVGSVKTKGNAYLNTFTVRLPRLRLTEE